MIIIANLKLLVYLEFWAQIMMGWGSIYKSTFFIQDEYAGLCLLIVIQS